MTAMWKVKYDNDTGPDDDSFWEWWSVVNDAGVCAAKCDTEQRAKLIAELLNENGIS